MIERIPYKACPLCGDPAITDLFETDCTRHPAYHPDLPPTIEWCECYKCRHVFTSGYFGEDGLALVFRQALAHQTPVYDVEKERWLWARVVELVVGQLGRPRGKWMDVGFGNGALLCTAQEWGFEAFGLDLRAEAVAGLGQFGIAAAVSTIEAYPGERGFGVISMADVLEHMPFPETALRAAHRLLRDDGVLFISTPNRNTAVWKVLDQNHVNPYWAELEHCHNFTRESLYRLLDAYGFAPAAYNVSHRYSSGMDVMARKIA